jgi:hypothetical protein
MNTSVMGCDNENSPSKADMDNRLAEILQCAQGIQFYMQVDPHNCAQHSESL